MVQTGNPAGTLIGGPGYKFNDEPVKGSYTVGMVAMANAGPNTKGSQFFICTGEDSKRFKKLYNLFGQVVQGLHMGHAIEGPRTVPGWNCVKAGRSDPLV